MLLSHARSLLFLPASNARAIDKARGLPCDMVILDLEDAVPDERKGEARTALAEAFAAGFGDRIGAVRINAVDSPFHADDLAAVRGIQADIIVLPKAEHPRDVQAVHGALEKPVIAMIESPLGVANAREIAQAPGVVGLFMGNNDLRRDLRIPLDAGREGLTYAMQSVILAARLAGVAVFDGVFNRIDDAVGFEAECRAGRVIGFDGKTLVHPNQIGPANAVFGASEEELETARRLIAAATGGAERHEGQMIEAMHVEQARALIARAEANRGDG
ncbi:HpcH/HpaI aldolase/citrate lyase family protein [Sphingobium subterraneum]|uniref:Citrate lyase subunit beta/citryl-CoA lyase n=1 Tax=Sphingobium subterraneum TaxID=627688 RepID=A0A841IW08_9SPHN|nr:CoA ester lyase [Sphingobium subterraneum]MBB6122534.1 citrate lyase subunit beta/citryl-CoA lyase [Sphingobium subterraneum]